MKILSINVGSVQPLKVPVDTGAKQVMSAIHKSSVSQLSSPTPQFVGAMGLQGDQQANLAVHGGVDKALYAYPFEHYHFWQELLTREAKVNTKLEFGSFGENLTVQGFTESSVYVGDLWRVGEVLLEVVKFREPCFKFNIKMGWSGSAKAMIQSNTFGWYLKVLEEGSIKAGDEVQVLQGRRELSILIQSSSFYSKSTQKDLWS